VRDVGGDVLGRVFRVDAGDRPEVGSVVADLQLAELGDDADVGPSESVFDLALTPPVECASSSSSALACC